MRLQPVCEASSCMHTGSHTTVIVYSIFYATSFTIQQGGGPPSRPSCCQCSDTHGPAQHLQHSMTATMLLEGQQAWPTGTLKATLLHAELRALCVIQQGPAQGGRCTLFIRTHPDVQADTHRARLLWLGLPGSAGRRTQSCTAACSGPGAQHVAQPAGSSSA